jgi:hypothetical protein
MRLLMILLLSLIVSSASWSAFAESSDKADHLFYIERSNNKNLVQYDIRLTENGDLLDSRPVNVYWILENGKREELNPIERMYAYGIVRQEKLDKNKFKVILAALKGLEIVVERMKHSYKAVASIYGKQIILDKFYIKYEERSTGLPKVLYIDLFGRTEEKGLPIRQRIAFK